MSWKFFKEWKLTIVWAFLQAFVALKLRGRGWKGNRKSFHWKLSTRGNQIFYGIKFVFHRLRRDSNFIWWFLNSFWKKQPSRKRHSVYKIIYGFSFDQNKFVCFYLLNFDNLLQETVTENWARGIFTWFYSTVSTDKRRRLWVFLQWSILKIKFWNLWKLILRQRTRFCLVDENVFEQIISSIEMLFFLILLQK